MEQIDLPHLPPEKKRRHEVVTKTAEEMAKTAEEEKRAKERSLYSMEQFWKYGFSGVIRVNKRNTPLSTVTFNHAIVSSFEARRFTIFENIEADEFPYPSSFLLQFHDTGIQSSMMAYYLCHDVAEIAYRVQLIVRDVLVYMGIQREVWVDHQPALVSVVEAGRRPPHVSVLIDVKSGVPIAVIVVKQPGISRLSDERVMGQVFDYMSNLRNSFGLCEVFGIITTLDEWRVVWLPDTDAFAASEDIYPHPTPHEDLTTQFPAESTVKRDLHGTDVFNWESPDILPLIATVILKSMRSRYREISLLSSNRAYIILCADNLEWGTFSDAELMEHPEINLALPQYAPTQLKVLREFHGGADGQVCLALTTEFNLVVVKKFFNEKKCEKEFKLWKEIYGVDVLCTKLLGSQCLIMPFVFQCVGRDGDIRFDFDLSNWARVRSSGLLGDLRFDAWTVKIMDFMKQHSDITVKKALYDAIEELARHCVVHGDLDWRHVALLPVVLHGEVIGMKAVLIDLAVAEIVASEEVARESMHEHMKDFISEFEQFAKL